MPLVSNSIPNLVGGVSQQPSKLRLTSQAEAQTSMLPSIVEGLSKRSPTEHIAKLADFAGGLSLSSLRIAGVHWINRDLAERYVVLMYGTTIRVFDLLTGTEKTVATPNGTSYLSVTSTSRAALRAVTVQDHTFIVNTEKTVAMGSPVADERGIEALVFVQLANYDSTYSVTLDNFTVAAKTNRFGYHSSNFLTGPDGNGTSTDPVAISTEFIAKCLAEDLIANHPTAADYTITYQASTIWIRRDNEATFAIEVSDSRAKTQIKLAKEQVARISDLPIVAPDGFEIEITGDANTNWDNYYVEFKPINSGQAFGEGQWFETVKKGIPVAFDPATMPHILERESNGTFTFRQGGWGERIAGDLDSAPDPSFVGRRIKDVFFVKNRLGFLAGENAILSRANEFFEFFVSTATTLVDSDPVDVPASHNKVSILNFAVAFKERLYCFSDKTQFILRYGDVLNNETAELKPVTEYENTIQTRPVGAGKSLFFTAARDQFTAIYEYLVAEDTELGATEGAEITSHVPTYIPSGIDTLTAAQNENFLAARTAIRPRSVFVYKYLWSGAEKLQSSWSVYDFYDNAAISEISDINLIDTNCYLLVGHSDGVFLERFSVAPRLTDIDAPFLFHLDRKVSETQCTESYNSTLDQTTITTPYVLPANTLVVARYPDNHTKKPGTVASIVSKSTNQVVVQGNWSAAKFYLGETYLSEYEFSPQYVRQSAAGGGQLIIGLGRLMMRVWTIHYSRSGYFEVHIQPLAGDNFVHKFTGLILGTSDAILGSVPVASGKVQVPIMCGNEEVTVKIVSRSHLPLHILLVEWEGEYNARARRL